MVDVTIIVCTKNRADALEQCLGSISKAILRCPGRKAEVIVVDNGSADDGCRITPYYISVMMAHFDHDEEPVIRGGLNLATRPICL